MIDYYNKKVNKIILIIIFTAMTGILYSQEPPEYDKVNTPAGIVEMHFMGHGSLMFKVNIG